MQVDGEDREHRQCSDFLDGLELRGVEFAGADAVCRYLETVFEECHAPIGHNYLPESFVALFQVSVLREGQENIGDGH